MRTRSRFAKGRLQDWVRRAAAAIMLTAFAVLVLQTTAHAGMDARMMHERGAFTMVDHPCHPSGDKAAMSRLAFSAPCGADAEELRSQGDSCEQLCAMTIVLPDPSAVVSPAGRDVPGRIWSDDLGHSAQGILRPPRTVAVA